MNFKVSKIWDSARAVGMNGLKEATSPVAVRDYAEKAKRVLGRWSQTLTMGR